MNLMMSYLSFKKSEQLLETKLSEFKFSNEQQINHGNQERIFQNIRHGLAILSYSAVHF